MVSFTCDFCGKPGPRYDEVEIAFIRRSEVVVDLCESCTKELYAKVERARAQRVTVSPFSCAGAYPGPIST